MQPGLFSDTPRGDQITSRVDARWFTSSVPFKVWIQSRKKKKKNAEQKEPMHQRLTAFGKKRHEEGTAEGKKHKEMRHGGAKWLTADCWWHEYSLKVGVVCKTPLHLTIQCECVTLCGCNLKHPFPVCLAINPFVAPQPGLMSDCIFRKRQENWKFFNKHKFAVFGTLLAVSF